MNIRYIFFWSTVSEGLSNLPGYHSSTINTEDLVMSGANPFFALCENEIISSAPSLFPQQASHFSHNMPLQLPKSIVCQRLTKPQSWLRTVFSLL